MVYYININRHIILCGIFWCSIMSMTTRCSRRRLAYHRRPIRLTYRYAQACELVSKLGITLVDIICRPCRDDIRRVLANCSYIPRWGKRNKLTKCCVNFELALVGLYLMHGDKAIETTRMCIYVHI